MSRTILAVLFFSLVACEPSVIRMDDEDATTDPGTEPNTDVVIDVVFEPDVVVDPGDDPVTEPATDPGTDPVVDPGTEPATDPVTDPGSGVCDRWRADRADLREGSWSGSVSGCVAGDVASPGRDNALKLVNLFRWMAGLPAVTLDAERNRKAQDCALMMHANGALSHSPPTSWACYTADGAEAAGRSNIGTSPGVDAVDMYMQDWGNESTLGHRRWILSNSLGPIGQGSTSEYSCLWVLYGSGSAGASWTSWPPPGDFPIQAVTMSWRGLDSTGWTVQSDSIDLDRATGVTVTAGGSSLAVSFVHLLNGYGSSTAINFIPSGWSSTVGTTYHVEVQGVSTPISYDVTMVDCS
jgi:hypothetical protein